MATGPRISIVAKEEDRWSDWGLEKKSLDGSGFSMGRATGHSRLAVRGVDTVHDGNPFPNL